MGMRNMPDPGGHPRRKHPVRAKLKPDQESLMGRMVQHMRNLKRMNMSKVR